MNVKAKIFFKNTVTNSKSDGLKIKKLIIINDLLLVKELTDYNSLLNKYDFYDENNIPTYFKKYNISIEEWFDLLKGKNFEDFLNNNKDPKIKIEYQNKIFEDFLNFYKEIEINEINNITIEIFDNF